MKEKRTMVDSEGKRHVFQEEIIKKYKKTLIAIKVDYPGNNKDNYLTKNIIGCVDNILTDIFKDKVYLKIFRITEEGPIITILLNLDSYEVKKTCIEIEDKHALGGIIDIEVYDLNGKIIDRQSVGYEEKRCIICGESASKCKKLNSHSISEILENMKHIYTEYIGKHFNEVY
jgi:holo-ACP synthase